MAGSLDSGACIPRLLADAGAVVMSIDYPLAPVHPFPQAVETGYAALAWAFKARQKLAGKGAPTVPVYVSESAWVGIHASGSKVKGPIA